MNQTIKKIMNGQEVLPEEIFELINHFDITSLTVQEGDIVVLKMMVNHFESYKDIFEFSQEHIDENIYVVKQSDILSIETRWEKEINCMAIMCRMSDNKKMTLIIYHVSNDFNSPKLNDYYEVDLDSVYKFLDDTLNDDGKYRCTLVKVSDNFSILLKMLYPQKVFIDTLDEFDWKLYIGNGVTELNISVLDDSYCNTFYRKDDGSSVEIIVKPYGQPFMEVKMLFHKRK